MTAPTFAMLKQGYTNLWQTMVTRPDKVALVNSIVTRILSYKDRYLTVQRDTGVPWFIVAIIHKMECNGRFDEHLHNGDPLSAKTVQVPAGRPPGDPPWTWEFSAADALSIDGLDKIKFTSVEIAAYAFEKYNGFGSREKGINTPYLWSYSNQYTRGKFVRDHVYDPNAVSEQCGAMPILKRLMEVDKSVTFAPSAAPAAVATVAAVASLGAIHADAGFDKANPVLISAGVLIILAFVLWLLWRNRKGT